MLQLDIPFLLKLASALDLQGNYKLADKLDQHIHQNKAVKDLLHVVQGKSHGNDLDLRDLEKALTSLGYHYRMTGNHHGLFSHPRLRGEMFPSGAIDLGGKGKEHSTVPKEISRIKRALQVTHPNLF